MYFSLEYIGYWSQARDGALSPALTTAKVNCRLHSHHLYLAAIGMAWSLLDSQGNKRPGSLIHVFVSWQHFDCISRCRLFSDGLDKLCDSCQVLPLFPACPLTSVLTTNSNLVATKQCLANFFHTEDREGMFRCKINGGVFLSAYCSHDLKQKKPRFFSEFFM